VARALVRAASRLVSTLDFEFDITYKQASRRVSELLISPRDFEVSRNMT